MLVFARQLSRVEAHGLIDYDRALQCFSPVLHTLSVVMEATPENVLELMAEE